MKKAKVKGTEVPVNKNRGLAPTAKGSTTIAPAGGVKGRGFENIDRKDILLPRVKLLQPLSPEVTGDAGMKAGTILVNLTNKNLGTEIIITPILHFRSRIKWLNKDDGGGIECSSPDAKKPLGEIFSTECGTCEAKDWNNDAKKEKDQQPSCTLYENFLVLVGDAREPVLIPMERTKLKVARKFYSMGALKGGDMWDWQYKISVTKEKNEADQTYYNYVVTDLTKATPDDRKKYCESIWKSLSTKTLQAAEMEHPETEATSVKEISSTTSESKY